MALETSKSVPRVAVVICPYWRCCNRLLAAFVFALVTWVDVQAASMEANREALRREAWVAGQMSAIERDPRVYLNYQKALTAEIFRRESPLLNERYVPRLGDAIKELSKSAWDFAKSDEVDLALSTGEYATGVGGRLGKTVGVLKNLKDYGIKVENVNEKWERDDARKFVSLVREDLEDVLREVYTKGNALDKRSAGKGYRPDFLIDTDKIAKRFSLVTPYATDQQIFASAPAGPLAVKIYEKLSQKSDAQLAQILASRDEFKKFVTNELEGQEKVLQSISSEMEAMQKSLSELIAAKRAQEAADKLAKRQAAFDLKYTRANEYTYAVAAAMQFIDPQAAEFVQKGGSAMLLMTRSIESLAIDGFSAAATGNLLGSAFTVYSLLSVKGEDPATTAMRAQFEALAAKMNVLSKQLEGIDKKIDQFVKAQNAGYSDIRDQLHTATIELRLLQTFLIENENAKIQADINSASLICDDRLASGLFSTENPNSLDYFHQCLWRMYAFGIIESSKPSIVYTIFSNNPANKSNLMQVKEKLTKGDDLETMVAGVEFLERYAAKNLDIKINTPSLRAFSSAFNTRAIDGSNIFSPQLWSAAIKSLITYRLGFSEYAPPPNAPSSRYLRELAEIGEWMTQRFNVLSSDDMVFRALAAYRSRALEVARLSDTLMRAELAQRYPAAFHASRLGDDLKGYLDLPISFFLGFETDREWRTNGFSASSMRDLISLAGLMGLLSVDTTTVKTTNDNVVGSGKLFCYNADAKVFLQIEPRLELGTITVKSCGTLTDDGLTGHSQAKNIRDSAEYLASSFAKFGYISPYFNPKFTIPDDQVPGLKVDFNGRNIQRGIVSLEIIGEDYLAASNEQLKKVLTAEAAKVALAAHNSYFADAPNAPISNRSAARANVFEPLNEAYAAMLLSLNARHGGCGNANPHLVKLRYAAMSELDLEDYVNGKNILFGQKFWQSLMLTVDEGAVRLLPLTRNTGASGTSFQAVIEALGKAARTPSATSPDLYLRARDHFSHPSDPETYRYCAESGMPSLVTGMIAVSRWNDLMEFGAGKILGLSPENANPKATGTSDIYKCTKRGYPTIFQSSSCPAGYRQISVSKTASTATR